MSVTVRVPTGHVFRVDRARGLAGELLGRPLELPLGLGEPESGRDFRRLATLHTFGDSWTRTSKPDTAPAV